MDLDAIPDWTLHWLEAEGDLAPWREKIEREILASWQLIAGHFVPPRLDILVQCLPGRTIPETGMGGRAFRPSLLSMELDPGNVHFAASIREQALRRLLVHEVHHCLRMAVIGYGQTLGDALASEGLAGQFVRHVLGSPPEPWERALDDAALRAHSPSASELATSDYDHDAWFYGSGDRHPRWLGYTLGYRMVGEWLTRNTNPGRRWVDVPASDILQAWNQVGAEHA